MANRKGVFIGAYVPNHLKESLRRRAAAEHRLSRRKSRAFWKRQCTVKACLPAVWIGATRESTPRRRATDPAPRRRNVDVTYTPAGSLATIRS